MSNDLDLYFSQMYMAFKPWRKQWWQRRLCRHLAYFTTTQYGAIVLKCEKCKWEFAYVGVTGHIDLGVDK